MQNSQYKDKQKNNNWKTEMGRKTTVWIFQAANWRNLTQKDLDMILKERPGHDSKRKTLREKPNFL